MHGRHLVLAAALSVLPAAAARAESYSEGAACAPAPGAAVAVSWKPRAWAPPGRAGLWVSRDPVDGTLGMPEPGVRRDGIGYGMRPGDERSVPVTRLADGTLIAHLDERWASFAVARLGAGGRPAWGCVEGVHGVEQFMARPTPPATQWEER